MKTQPIFLGSILLEPKRWQPGRPASIRMSEWSTRAVDAGFDGWELWENHYLLADARERAALREGVLPIRVFNSYADFGENSAVPPLAPLNAIAELASVSAIKFNVGNDPRQVVHYRAAIASLRQALPTGIDLWCECHPGTLLEEPSRLEDFTENGAHWPFDIILHPFLLGPEEIIRWGKLAGPHIRHAHVQIRDLSNPQKFLSIADEPGRVNECLAALAAISFSGSYTLEFARHTRTRDDVPEILFTDAVHDLNFLRTALARL